MMRVIPVGMSFFLLAATDQSGQNSTPYAATYQRTELLVLAAGCFSSRLPLRGHTPRAGMNILQAEDALRFRSRRHGNVARAGCGQPGRGGSCVRSADTGVIYLCM